MELRFRAVTFGGAPSGTKRVKASFNRPLSLYQYSNMAPRFSGQNSMFSAVFFVFNSLLVIDRQKKVENFTILSRKPRSHVRILILILIIINRTWPI